MTVSLQYPWDTDKVPPATPPAGATPLATPKPRGRRPAGVTRAMAASIRTAPDWLFHHLTVSGPADGVTKFAASARGAGVIPWQLDVSDIAETVFNLAVSQPAAQRNLTIAGCRILARQLAEKAAARQARAAARVGHSVLCSFDLHTLLPVPETILLLGPTHPTALAWLKAHWGTTDGLRQVVLRDRATTGRRLKQGYAVIGYGFFTDGETPHAAIGELEKRWPALRFVLQPRPAD